MKALIYPTIIAIQLTMYSCTQPMNSNIGKKLNIKDPKTVQVPSHPKLKIKDQLTSFYSMPQIFKINTNQDTTIYGAQGTQIVIHVNCLQDEKGNKVSGTVEIELKELYSKKDMILANKPTMTDGKLLESNGEIYLNAKKDGYNLFIGCPEGLEVTSTTPQIDRMEMWLGKIDNKGNMNWEKDKTITSIKSESDSERENQKYDETEPVDPEGSVWYNEGYNIYSGTEQMINKSMFKTQKFGWINCDRFYEDPREKTEMYVQLKNPFPKEYQTYMYVLFHDINSVMQLYSNDGENYSISNIPEGENISIVCVSATEMKTYFSIKETMVTKGNKEQLELKPMAKAEIEKVLEKI